MSSFWGSTAALGQFEALQRHGEIGGIALRRAALIEAARREMCRKLAATDLTPKQRMLALQLIVASRAAGDEIEATGSCAGWANEIRIHRGTALEAMMRLATLGLLDIESKGSRHVPWRLRWLFTSAEWQVIHGDAVASVQQMLADASPESNTRPNNLLKTAR